MNKPQEEAAGRLRGTVSVIFVLHGVSISPERRVIKMTFSLEFLHTLLMIKEKKSQNEALKLKRTTQTQS